MTLRIKKLDLFILRQFSLLFVGTFFICQFVLMMQFLWRSIDNLIGKGLTLDVMAQFFWYLGLMLVPQALPLAVLLSSLITFGNLGESSELTAIKASGTSLMQTFRSLIVVSLLITVGSFYFQDRIGPSVTVKLSQLLISMKQKSPEVEIPEGVFYDGIPNTNLYVQKKNMDTGKLYGIMIYRMTNSFEDAAIILADSGMLQSTADRKHLLLTLWHGEWFENMQQQQFGQSAAVPYRRETFINKRIVLDFDADFNLTDASSLSANAKGKSTRQILHDLDSIKAEYKGIAKDYYRESQMMYFHTMSAGDSVTRSAPNVAQSVPKGLPLDTIFNRLPLDKKQSVVSAANGEVHAMLTDLDFKSMVIAEGARIIRQHYLEALGKITLALTCIIFFFIGAPLGAIIRKGGLGIPVIISVLVFIVYYILDNSGYRMAREGIWSVWFGRGLAPAILIPTAIFVTYKANKDSVVFNMDLYRNIWMKLWGLRLKRHIYSKEVVILTPQYREDMERLQAIGKEVESYAHRHRLKRMPHPIYTFFKYKPDHDIERLSEQLENVIEDLSNTRDKALLTYLNAYPILSAKAHTRPFDRRWLNILTALIVPLALVLYIRMWMFRLRLWNDLRTICHTNGQIIDRIQTMIDTPQDNQNTPII